MRRMTKFAAAILAGAMVMAIPSVASASTIVDKNTPDPGLPVATIDVAKIDGVNCFTWNINLADNQELGFEVSADPSFPNDEKTTSLTWFDSSDNYSKEGWIPSDWSIGDESRKMGTTYYIRAVVEECDYDEGNWKYGNYSNVISYVPEVTQASINNCEVTPKSVTFTFSNDDEITGYEIYRTKNNNYTKIATITDKTYVDTKVKENTTYKYKIVSYVFDEATKTKSYAAKPAFKTVTTWGNGMNVQAEALNATSVKVSWKKVNGATGYKVYRYVGSSSAPAKIGDSNYYSNRKLVKTIKKAGTTTFTDKNLDPGASYEYLIEAYKTVKVSKKKKDTIVISDSDYVNLELGYFQSPDGNSEYETATAKDNTITVMWKKFYGAEGIILQREYRNEDGTYTWNDVNRFPGTQTTCTIPAYTVAEQEAADTEKAYATRYYRLVAFAGKEKRVSREIYAAEISKKNTLQGTSVDGIQATAAADAITVQWAPIPGAAYYRVYRSTRPGRYLPNTDSYSIYGNYIKIVDAKNPGKLSEDGTYYVDSPIYTINIAGTSVVDTFQGYPKKTYDSEGKDVIKTEKIQKGPQAGVRYYYSVKAYGADGDVIDTRIYSTHYTKPATAMITSTAAPGKAAIKAIKVGKKKATVSWKAVANADMYVVYYSTKKNGAYEVGGSTTGTKVTVSGLEKGKSYYFKVKAVKANEAGGDVDGALSAAKRSKKIK